MSIYVYNTYMNRTIIDFSLLIILILIIYFRNNTLVSFFNSVLGRLILIILIIILSLRDTLWGLLALILLVVFRESYVEEGMENMNNSNESSLQENTQESLNIEPLIDPKDVPSNGTVSIKDVRNTIFTETVSKVLTEPHDITPNEWRKENCSSDNKPIYNNKEISNQEVPNLFKNFAYVDEVCNPCDMKCNFKITSSKDVVEVSEKIRPKSSNENIIGPSRDGNATAKPTQTPAPAPEPTPQISPEELKKSCDYKDSSKCIFSDYTKEGDNCLLKGSSQTYNASALAGYDNSTFVGWLQGLFKRNLPGTTKTNDEANIVYNYWNKCKSIPGFEYLNQLNLVKPKPPSENVMDNLPDCVVNGINIKGWKQKPDGVCIAPQGQKCCNISKYQDKEVCEADFTGYDTYWTNQWISSCIQK